jgi:hypothetical protein
MSTRSHYYCGSLRYLAEATRLLLLTICIQIQWIELDLTMTNVQQRAELQRRIWQIANDVRGAVDGWDFKQYVLGTLFYRFISENFAAYMEGGDGSVHYAELPDSIITPDIKDDALKTKGYCIYPSQLFASVVAGANTNESLNTHLAHIFTAIESSANGESRAEYGHALMSKLSRYLGEQFGQGFSVANLKNFRQFYLTFPSPDEFATHCVANLGWTHVRLIMRLESAAERNYYLQESSSQNWSSRLLERNIKSGNYRRVLAHQNPQNDELPSNNAAPFIKDPYVLEFLGVPDHLSGKESLLEQSLINQLRGDIDAIVAEIEGEEVDV